VWHAESVEALIRWEHPGLGLLTPDEFLPLAGPDRGALMHRLTDFVIQRGIEYLQAWQNNGLHLGLRVNVAGALIADTSFPDRLERFMLENQIDPSLLTLEIGDASALVNCKDGIEILTRLRLKEVRIALSDFGSQDQSIPALYLLPISEIKVDKKIAADLRQEEGASFLLQGFADIAAKLGVSLCLEGIESAQQLRVADDLGCDLAQGFFISEPVPSSEVAKAVSSWTANVTQQVPSGA
jgi:EAL domain-containing protein (putative c-di-GMP-specific phosphodiesterase class I)